MYEKGQIKPFVTETFPLEQTAEAINKLANRNAIGKITCKPGETPQGTYELRITITDANGGTNQINLMGSLVNIAPSLIEVPYAQLTGASPGSNQGNRPYMLMKRHLK